MASGQSRYLAERASFFRGSSFFEGGDYEGAASAFEAFIKAYPESALLPEALLKLAVCFTGSGAPEKAVALLKELEAGYPGSREAADAQKRLRAIEASGLDSAKPTAEERLRKAEGLFRAAFFEQALEEYAPLLGRPEFRERALFRTAVANARLKRYPEAERLIKEYLSGTPLSREAQALYWYAFASVRQGREDGALEAEKRLAGKFPKSQERAMVLMLLGRFREGKDPEGPVNAYRAVVDTFRDSPVSDDAFWNIAWGAYVSGRPDNAYDGFSAYLEARPAGKDALKSKYWKARSAERLGREDEAAGLYEEVCGGGRDSFYCLMSAARGRVSVNGLGPGRAGYGLSRPVSANNGITEPPYAEEPFLESPIAGRPRYRAALELLLLGLNDEAAEEIDAAARLVPGEKEGLDGLAALFYEAGDFYRAFRIYRRHLSGSEETLHLGFPSGLVRAVREKSGGEADPFLVAAVAREESHFNPGAVSPAGALGLMQIMPVTGKGIARELGVEFERESLLEAETSIRFGSWYLGRLIKRFDGDLVLAVAGYNAGPSAAARWGGTLPYDLDEFVESIPYDETRGYAKRVLRSYAEFLRLAGEDPFERIRRAPAPPSL